MLSNGLGNYVRLIGLFLAIGICVVLVNLPDSQPQKPVAAVVSVQRALPYLLAQRGKAFQAIVSTATLPPPRADVNDLLSAGVLGVGPYLQNGQPQDQVWMNNSGKTIQIWQTHVWTGCSISCKADVGCYVTRISDGSALALYQWDHYAEPVAESTQVVTLPGYMAVAPGDGLHMTAISFGTNPTSQTQTGLWIWFTYQ